MPTKGKLPAHTVNGFGRLHQGVEALETHRQTLQHLAELVLNNWLNCLVATAPNGIAEESKTRAIRSDAITDLMSAFDARDNDRLVTVLNRWLHGLGMMDYSFFIGPLAADTRQQKYSQVALFLVPADWPNPVT